MPPRHGHASPLAFWPAQAQAGGHEATGALSAPAPVPAPVPEAPAALVLPALGVPAGAYRRLAEALAAQGTPVGVVEWRGGGASPVRAARGVDWGYLDLLQHEVLGGLAALRERLHEGLPSGLQDGLHDGENDGPNDGPSDGRPDPSHGRRQALAGERPVVVIGHSLGGHLGLMARAIAAPGLTGVLMVASGTPTLRFFAPRLRALIRVVLATHRLSGPLLGYFPGHRIGFGGRQSRRLMDEWALLARLGRFEMQGRNLLEPQSEAARRMPVHAMCLPHDAYAPRAATAHLLRLAGLGEECIEPYEGPGPPGHFEWLREPQGVAARLHALMREG